MQPAETKKPHLNRLQARSARIGSQSGKKNKLLITIIEKGPNTSLHGGLACRSGAGEGGKRAGDGREPRGFPARQVPPAASRPSPRARLPTPVSRPRARGSFPSEDGSRRPPRRRPPPLPPAVRRGAAPPRPLPLTQGQGSLARRRRQRQQPPPALLLLPLPPPTPPLAPGWPGRGLPRRQGSPPASPIPTRRAHLLRPPALPPSPPPPSSC